MRHVDTADSLLHMARRHQDIPVAISDVWLIGGVLRPTPPVAALVGVALAWRWGDIDTQAATAWVGGLTAGHIATMDAELVDTTEQHVAAVLGELDDDTVSDAARYRACLEGSRLLLGRDCHFGWAERLDRVARDRHLDHYLRLRAEQAGTPSWVWLESPMCPPDMDPYPWWTAAALSVLWQTGYGREAGGQAPAL